MKSTEAQSLDWYRPEQTKPHGDAVRIVESRAILTPNVATCSAGGDGGGVRRVHKKKPKKKKYQYSTHRRRLRGRGV